MTGTISIAVVAANGKAGRLIVKEAVERGFDVTAVVRGENRTVAPHAIVKDLFDLTAADLDGFDVVVDAFGAWTPETLDQHSESVNHLSDILSGTDTRLIVVGGAGSLYVDPEHTTHLFDTPEFPDEYVPLSKAQGAALDEIRRRDDVRWTFVSPAAEFIADGERTGRYVLAGEELTTDDAGRSEISYADYAVAIVDLATADDANTHVGERVSVRW
ncbi:NAD(P)-dependent oxidoreductase [Bifidobacterium catulorum]|uniref:NADH-flavin reductase n=1 Tax=Bifidobacterium catulorum TaxID=1630173 RepID=A0A2U2MST6_9BIFI|nr:NAD(P)H-binding protein [Bifidobacterium catulorum]PWG59909.1 NADH-flavin reductase [Bifidobacterium catulorum]